MQCTSDVPQGAISIPVMQVLSHEWPSVSVWDMLAKQMTGDLLYASDLHPSNRSHSSPRRYPKAIDAESTKALVASHPTVTRTRGTPEQNISR